MVKPSNVSSFNKRLDILTVEWPDGYQSWKKAYILVQHQKPDGVIELYALGTANGGIDFQIKLVGAKKANNYHCDSCVCWLTEQEICEVAQGSQFLEESNSFWLELHPRK